MYIVYMYTHIYMYVYTHTHTHTHTHIYVYTHKHTHTGLQGKTMLSGWRRDFSGIWGLYSKRALSEEKRVRAGTGQGRILDDTTSKNNYPHV